MDIISILFNFSTRFPHHVLAKLGGWERPVEEKSVMECWRRELLNLSCLVKMIFHTLYALRVPSLKATALQGAFFN